MDAVTLLIIIIAWWAVMYCINNFFAVDPKVKNLINLVMLLLFVVWVLGFSGLPIFHRSITR